VEEPERKTSPLPMAVVAVVVAAAAAIFGLRPPLTSSRPSTGLSTHRSAGFVEDVDARLWQDPLFAVTSERSRALKAPQPSAGAAWVTVQACVSSLGQLLTDRLGSSCKPERETDEKSQDSSEHFENLVARLEAVLARSRPKAADSATTPAVNAVSTLATDLATFSEHKDLANLCSDVKDVEQSFDDQVRRVEPHSLAAVIPRLVDEHLPDPGESGTTETSTADSPTSEGSGGETRSDDCCAAPLPKRQLSILAVMTNEAPYAAVREQRLYTRYAVVAALGRAGYVPLDGQHIGYFLLPDCWPVTDLADAGVPEPTAVPFEWYQYAPTEYEGSSEAPPAATRDGDAVERHVLVLWVPNDAVARAPLARTTWLAGALEKRFEDATGGKGNRALEIVVKIVGPTSSTELQQMVEKAAKATGPNQSEATKLEMWSPLATADDEDILRNLRDRCLDEDGTDARTCEGRFPDVGLLLARSGFDFHRTIATDGTVAKTLVHELQIRGLDVGNTKQHVVLLSEWDTTYGRSLPRALERSLREAAKLADADGFPTLDSYYYLRGLDGRLPGDDREAVRVSNPEQATDPTAAKLGAQPTGEWERPEGRSQVDHVRRLAGDLSELEVMLRQRDSAQIKAVGVLGTDVYDKLLVLRAVRRSFPRAVFFTTDLDELLSDPAEFEWSRNLVVASSFGLELNDDLQRGVPPFRNTYQTSLYLATLAAVSHGERRTRLLTYLESARRDPRIFELSRGRPYDLSTAVSSRTEDSVHPDRGDYSLGQYVAKRAIGALVLGLILAWTTRRLFTRLRRQPPVPMNAAAWMLLGTALAIVTVIVILAIFDSRQIGGEPFSFLDGVSIWPALILRSIAGLLAAWFIVKGAIDLRANEIELTRIFRLPTDRPPLKKQLAQALSDLDAERERKASVWAPGWLWYRALVRAFGIVSEPDRLLGERERLTVEPEHVTGKPERPPARSAAKIWEYTAARGRLGSVVLRVVPQTALFMALAFLLMGIFGTPGVPGRSALSRAAHYLSLGLIIPLATGLTFFVFDAARRCHAFVCAVGSSRTQWPEDLATTFAEERGMQPEQVQDWLTIRAIAQRSTAALKLVYYPFIVIALGIVSRSRWFDDWDFPIGLILVFAIIALYAIICAVALRRAAESARRGAIDRLTTDLLKSQTEDGGKAGAQLSTIIDRVRSVQEGAFMPLSKHPIIGAIALPTGGLGGLALLQYLLGS
jgi:hypothetical protein